MAHNSSALPQLTGSPFVTDGDSETTLIFHDGSAQPKSGEERSDETTVG
jgi:hypothetical protein